MKTYVILSSCFFFFLIFGLRAQDGSGFTEEYIKNISKAAPHIPQRPNRFDKLNTEEETYKLRNEITKWVKEYPDEFNAALKLDAFLNIYVPPPNDLPPKEDPYPYPEFMRYSVTEEKPVYDNTKNTEQYKKAYNMMLQHWYFLYDKKGYIEKYGQLPEIKKEPVTYPVFDPVTAPKGY